MAGRFSSKNNQNNPESSSSDYLWTQRVRFEQGKSEDRCRCLCSMTDKIKKFRCEVGGLYR